MQLFRNLQFHYQSTTKKLIKTADQLEQLEEELSISQGALAVFKAINVEYLQTIDELKKANVSQGSELQRQAEKLTAEREKAHNLQERLDQLTADHVMVLSDKPTLQTELKTALGEIECLNNALAIATEKQDSLTATNTELSQLAMQKTTENAHLNGKLEVLEQQLQEGMDREKGQLVKTDQLQVRMNELAAQNATLVEQVKQLQRLQEEQIQKT